VPTRARPVSRKASNIPAEEESQMAPKHTEKNKTKEGDDE